MELKRLKDAYLDLCGRYVSPVDFAPSVSFRRSKSSSRDTYEPSLTPYLSDILTAWDFRRHRREITVCAPEQTGKTLSWLIGILWSFVHRPGLSLVVYPSLDKAVQINEDKLLPLMMEIPSLARELESPRSKRIDSYHLSRARSYFLGAGQPITSASASITIADELDDWQEHDGLVANLQDLRKRMRSFDESLLVKVCTPRGDAAGSAIWTEFMRSSRGYWHLRCLGCGQLTLRSCDIKNLQFDSTEEGAVIPGSARLVCDRCGRNHVESDRAALNAGGAYVHEEPELTATHPGFQWGALASQFPALGWDELARSQFRAGRSGDYRDQIYFDNSIRGLPFLRRKSTDHEEQRVLSHRIAYPVDLKFDGGVCMGIDTQDECFFYVVRGRDAKRNTYLLKHGKALTLSDLDDALGAEYYGQHIRAAIIDEGGHRVREVRRWANDHKQVITYKGGSYGSALWYRQKEYAKGVIAREKAYKALLLHYILSKHDIEKTERQWYIPHNVADEYVKQLTALRPDKKYKNGAAYENWISDGNEHYFDCEKELLVLWDVLANDKTGAGRELETRRAAQKARRFQATYSKI